MTYFEGFVVPVPEANKEAYRKHAADARRSSRNSASSAMVEAWDSDVPEGKVTDFRMAVDAKPDEKVVFSWFEYPDKATRDAANEKMHERPAHEGHGRQHAVRRQAHDHRRLRRHRRGRQRAAAATPTASSCRCRRASATPIASSPRRWPRSSAQHGATRVVEAIADDVTQGEVTDFYRAVKAEDGEKVVFSLHRMARQGRPATRPGRRSWPTRA